MYPKGLSRRWSVTRELTARTNEEIATMVEETATEMMANGLAPQYISVHIDKQWDNTTRIKLLLRLDQWVTDRTIFYWFAVEKAIVESLTYEAFKRKKYKLATSGKTCLLKKNKEDFGIVPIRVESVKTPENSENEW